MGLECFWEGQGRGGEGGDCPQQTDYSPPPPSHAGSLSQTTLLQKEPLSNCFFPIHILRIRVRIYIQVCTLCSPLFSVSDGSSSDGCLHLDATEFQCYCSRGVRVPGFSHGGCSLVFWSSGLLLFCSFALLLFCSSALFA